MMYTILACAVMLVEAGAFRAYSSQRIFLKPVSMAVTVEKPQSPSVPFNLQNIQFSGLNGKALKENRIPSLGEVKAVIPKDVFVKDTPKSLAYAAFDVIHTSFWAFLGYKFLLPLGFNKFTLLGWVAYAVITGTAAIGMWVTAHECGHGAFSDNRKLQDFVGYLYHSLLLVPYFSWQRSHAVHHANTNHVVDGETHVPVIQPWSMKSVISKVFGNFLGRQIWGISQVVAHLVFGWPAYLLFGKTGGSSRGVTNHFVPFPLTKPANPTKELFPGAWKAKVILSDLGIAAAATGLAFLTKKVGWKTMAAMYGGPYLVVNAWLVLYTWLQHTDTDIPHVASKDFSFMRGAFLTVDRPYEKILGGYVDFIHHHIGSTHVAHHIDCTIPHYNARRATEAIKSNFPDLYLHDPTPIAEATWRIAVNCSVVQPIKVTNEADQSEKDLYVFVE